MDRRKMISKKIDSLRFKLFRINKNKPLQFFFYQSHDTVRGIGGTPIHLWNKASE